MRREAHTRHWRRPIHSNQLVAKGPSGVHPEAKRLCTLEAAEMEQGGEARLPELKLGKPGRASVGRIW